MTNKENFLYRLNRARVSHVHWVGMIKLLSSDLLKDKSSLKLNSTEISFGKWLNEDAMLFRDTSCSDVIFNIEKLWVDIHHQYMTIYEICISNRKKNLLGLTRSLNSSEKQLAAYHYQELVVLTDKLQQKLRIFEKQLNAKGEQEFEKFAHYSKEIEEQKSLENKKKETSINGVSGARGAYFSNND